MSRYSPLKARKIAANMVTYPTTTLKIVRPIAAP
jgi:hypothetical protein